MHSSTGGGAGLTVLVGNPAAGRGAGAASLARAEALLRARGVDVVVRRTRAPGHAAELARGAWRDGARLLLVLGGDGTIRDSAAGLLGGSPGNETSPPVLGLLPMGTGNDLARGLALPLRLEPALDAVLDGRERTLDAWIWNRTPFVNVAGVGLDAAVAREVNRRFSRLRGPLPYVAGLLLVLARFRPFPLRLRWADGEWAGRAWLAALGNGCCYGGGMRIAPDAVPDDGLLDGIVVEATSRLDLLRQFPRIFKGSHVQHPRVHVLRFDAVRIEAAGQPVTLDGELLDGVPASVTRAARRIVVRVPQGGRGH